MTVEQLYDYEGSLAEISGLGERRLKEMVARFGISDNLRLPDHARLDTLVGQLTPRQQTMSFDTFPMSIRLKNVLSNCGIKTPYDLLERAQTSISPNQKTPSAILLHTPNVGRNSVRELCRVIETMLAVSGSIPTARPVGRSNDLVAQ